MVLSLSLKHQRGGKLLARLSSISAILFHVALLKDFFFVSSHLSAQIGGEKTCPSYADHLLIVLRSLEP